MDLMNKILKDRGNVIDDSGFSARVVIYEMLRLYFQFRIKCE